MFRWKKQGLVFKPQAIEGRPWLREFAQAPSVLIFDDFVRVYFSCRPAPDARGQYTSYSAYVDLNRRNLFEIVNIAKAPILELGELGTFDEFGTYPVSVIRNGVDVLAYYGGWTRCESIPFTVSIGAAVSRDNGESFTKLGRGPLLTCNIDDPFVLSGPKIRRFNDQWCLWYVAGTAWLENDGKPEAVYKIRMATSDDGLNWARSGKNLVENKLEENECQASPDVFFHNNKYHMFFCYKYCLDFRNNDRGYRIGYAVSDDMVNWIRDDTKAGIDISPEGWDDQSISYPHVFALDGDIYMFYLGNAVGRYGFGLAQLEGHLS
ncbi:MAG: glycosylase [Betaproteobacteria bacterium]